MSVHKYKMKNSFGYRAVVQIGSKQYSKKFSRKNDAESWEREQYMLYKSDRFRTVVLANRQKSLSDLCDHWVEEYARRHKTASSVRRDLQIIRNQIKPLLGHYLLGNLQSSDFEIWMNKIRFDLELAPKTANNCLNLLKKILNDGVRWKWVSGNEARLVQSFRSQKTTAKFWTYDEAVTLVKYVKEHRRQLYPVFALALYTGLRKGEIRGLKWDCVDLKGSRIDVKRIYCDAEGKVVERTKGKRDRWVPINGQLRDMLVELRASSKSEFVALDFNWTHPHRLMAQISRRAGVSNIRFHDIRHTFASHLVMNGKPLYEVQKLLGHANYSTTEKYAHLAPDYLRGATDCLSFESVESESGNILQLRK